MRAGVIGAAIFIASCDPANESAMRAHEISLAVAEPATMAAWHGGEGKQSVIFVQELDAEGRLTGAAKAVSDGPGFAYEPDIVTSVNGFAVAWYTVDARSGVRSVWLAGLSAQGEKLWEKRIGGEGVNARNPVLRAMEGKLHLAWIEGDAVEPDQQPRVVYQVFLNDGTSAGALKTVGSASTTTWNLNAAVHEGQLILTYDAKLSTRASELQMIVISGDSATHHVLSSDDGFASLYPDLQINDQGVAALTWFDERDGNQEVYLAVAPYSRIISEQPAALRVTHSDGPTIGAYAAWNGDRLGLAWVDNVGGRSDLYAQAFKADGTALFPARSISRQLGGDEKGSAGVPAIRAYNGGFLIGWNSYRLRGDSGHTDVISSQAHFALLPLTP